jgi:hypothetical protein
MTGMPPKFRRLIGAQWEDPTIDRPILRRLPIGWELDVEPQRKAPAWWRFVPDPGRLLKWLVIFVLCYAALDVFGAFYARAADKPQFRKAVLVQPVWTRQRCQALGRTYIASSSDGRAWKVRCTGRPVRT